MAIHSVLTCLPLGRPEPGLFDWDGYLRSQLDDAVISLDHLDLSPGLIQVMAPPKIGRQNNLSPTSDADK